MMIRTLLATLLFLPATGRAFASNLIEARETSADRSRAQAGDRESLEEMLKRLEVKRAQLLAELKAQLDPLLLELRKAVEGKSARELKRVRERIAMIGPAIAPLLTPSLDPGPEPKRSDLEFSRQVSRVLVLIPTSSITDELLALSQSGTPLGKQNALRVLSVSPEPTRVSPRLIQRYAKSEGQDRAYLLSVIAKLGQPEGDQLLRDALLGEDEGLQGVALDAMVSSGAAQFAGDVLALLKDLDRSADFAYKFVAYYANCPDVVDKEHVGALLAAATDTRVKADQQIAILEKLPIWERYIDSRMKRALKDFETPANRGVEQQAQILLAVLGDASARKRLLKPYDEAIEDGKSWTGEYVARGMILYKINEFSQALRDFKQAVKLSKDEPRSVPEAYEYAARCNARMGNLKKAAKWLEDSPIDLKQLRALASDPVFQELRESRYGKVFRLENNE